MAVLSGYDVAVVAGKRNHGLCTSLGASKVFDHSGPNVVSTVVEALKGHELVGAFDAIGDHEKSTKPCAEVLSQTQGSKKLISSLQPPESGLPDNVQALRG
jgi:NADPH:quinone reductase-like Zn-dependent oxidoreductase